MRKALIGFLLAATAGLPAAAQAQDSDSREERRAAVRAERAREHYQAAGERNQARAERRQEAQSQRAERQEQRVERQQVRQERVEAPVQQQQQQQQSWSRRGGDDGQRSQGWSRRGDGDGQRSQGWDGGQRSERWSGRDGRGDARREEYRRRVEESRQANQASIDATVGGNYAREGQRNQERYERRLREQYGVGRRDNDRRDWNRDGRRDRRWSDRSGSRRSGWDRGWRNDNRYDWQRYRYSNRDRFRLGSYYSPYRGYRYNRLSIGLFLDSLFYSNRYWLSDPWQYRLPPAPYGTQWVRYYDDVVLVDVYTGEVLDVIYDFFW